LKTRIEKLIKGFVEDYGSRIDIRSRWREPIITYADAKDQLFIKLKEIISSTHGLPKDFLPDAKTVIAYFIPFDDTIVNSNIEGKMSSKEWAIAYIETNQLIYDLNSFLKIKINELGYDSTIIPATHNFNEEKLISDWSHRHVAYIAGLGKFGINNMLITDKGCCGRVGTIVTNMEIDATVRKEEEYCLYKRNGTCHICVDRCVNNALSIDSFDRHKCYEMCLINAEIHNDIGLADVCGKCLVNLPCSMKKP